jgi:dTDP-4-dehydrorhamnose reductase
MLAKDLVPRLRKRGHEVVCPPEDEFDITDGGMVKGVVTAVGPAVLYNCAAYNFVDRAETERERADTINGEGVHNLCLACSAEGIRLVHFSTDYVFDGTKNSPYRIDDEPNPINHYGRSKLAGERYVIDLVSEFYLVRTSWLFGVHGNNFVEAILKRARTHGELAVIDSETGCPTWTGHLADAVIDVVDSERYGIYHISNSGPATWYEFAEAILSLAKIRVPLNRTTPAALNRAARRPTNSVLDPHPLPEVLGRTMPSWREALREYINLRMELHGE